MVGNLPNLLKLVSQCLQITCAGVSHTKGRGYLTIFYYQMQYVLKMTKLRITHLCNIHFLHLLHFG